MKLIMLACTSNATIHRTSLHFLGNKISPWPQGPLNFTVTVFLRNSWSGAELRCRGLAARILVAQGTVGIRAGEEFARERNSPEVRAAPWKAAKWGAPPRVLELQGFREFGKGQMRMAEAARCWRSFTAPDLPARPAGTRQGSESEPGNVPGVWGRGRARAAGRSPGRHRPARRAVRPAHPERGGARAGEEEGGGGEVGAVSRSP